jgi:hypothetical protein
MARHKMILRQAGRMVAGIAFYVATVAALDIWPANTEPVGNNVEPDRADFGKSASHPMKAQPLEDMSTGNPVATIPLSKLSSTRDRPIFSASRRPPTQPVQQPPPPPTTIAVPAPAPAPTPAPAESEPPPFTLLGTVAGENSAIAVFMEHATGTIVRLHTNESRQGWKLHSVEGRQVTFQKGRESSVLAMPPPGTGSERTTNVQANPQLPTRERPGARSP